MADIVNEPWLNTTLNSVAILVGPDSDLMGVE